MLLTNKTSEDMTIIIILGLIGNILNGGLIHMGGRGFRK